MRSINEIIVHCADTPEGRDNTVADITRWHKDRGFRTIGYHYVIYRDGSIHNGRPIEEIGAHCKGHNAHSIGICYIGGKSADGKKHIDTRTPEQKEALLSLLRQLKARYPNAQIYGHRDFSSKPCPCFDARSEYRSLAVTILLVVSCLLFSSCRTTKRVVEEKADSEVLQTHSQSVTSSATDKFLQNIVLQIDSIVFTSLSVPQVPQADDCTGHIDSACDTSGSIPCAPETRTRSSSAKASGASRASPLNNNRGTKILISGIRLQSTTADSSSVKTEASLDSTRHSSYHSNVKAKEKKVPSLRLHLTLSAIAIMVIVAIAWYIRKRRLFP
ncbi:MAG: N-acetylmuramoyl-L-alanine amidase [Bacteroidaceae bacterium]|nr:N-acetylmuramoyl-L-alanine amidase [Bacteroidaceae bacterium]